MTSNQDLKFNLKSISIAAVLLMVAVSCIKNHRCVRQNEKQKHVINVDELPTQELRDTLEKYDNLSVSQVIDDQFTKGMYCNIYYKDFRIITDKYRLFKSMNTCEIWSLDTIPTYIDVELENDVSLKEALRIAEELEGFGAQCIRAELGIADVSKFSSAPADEFKMV